MFKYLLPILVLIPWLTQAEAIEVLTVDRSVSKNLQLSFPNDNNIKPKKSDFEIINYVLMSNEVGERWSVITLTNLSSGNREFTHDHLIGLFADGSRISPLEYKLNFKGQETQSITVSFGVHKFPILSIYSSNE
ncbi:hypothetical protein [Colwellia psychrerythraea]|uniref:Uncharacterized protein n=1 Tax=Colwellia psychrerythraea TaxID=28229 RepID=A0A099L327_COLPS|nr:hypothetical protein [Colwellia psychrerythraea]KGJ97369.1 hypothetical protein GAB14E_0958 [Colwellia psychrerythraea]